MTLKLVLSKYDELVRIPCSSPPAEAQEHHSHAQAARTYSTKYRSPAEIEASVPRKVDRWKSVPRVEYVPARTVPCRVSPERSIRNVTLGQRGRKTGYFARTTAHGDLDVTTIPGEKRGPIHHFSP